MLQSYTIILAFTILLCVFLCVNIHIFISMITGVGMRMAQWRSHLACTRIIYGHLNKMVRIP